MDDSSDRELEQLERIEQLRKLVQAILGNHICLMIVVFLLFLAIFLAFAYMSVTRSMDRYQATIVLHYYPNNTQKIQSYDTKYLVQMFNRQALIHKFFREMTDETGGKISSNRILVTQERKQNNSISITLFARTDNEAITLTNAFAQFCIREYTSERKTDLEKWRDALLQQKQDTFKEIQRINMEKDKLTVPLNVASPEKEYDRLRFTLGEKQAALVKLTLLVTNQQRKKEKLEEEMGELNPAILLYEKEIRGYTNDLKRIDTEILVLNEQYTEENPKMKAVLAQKKVLQENFDKFLRDKSISFYDINSIGKLDRITTELKGVSEELNVKEEELRLLKAEVSSGSEKFYKLNEIIPRYQQLSLQGANLLDSVQKINDNIADINYVLLLIKDDLFVGEQIEAAKGESWLNKKSIFIASFAAIVVTGFLALLTVLVEFRFGKVANAMEMELYSDFTFLGALPDSEKKLAGGDKESIVLNGIYHSFQNTGMEHHIVLVAELPGATIIQGLFKNITWNYGMAGKEVLTIDIIDAKDLNENTPTTDTCIISHRDWNGELPLENVNNITEAELQLLKTDLRILRKKYSLIFIRQKAPIRDALFLKKISVVCDGLLIGIGAKRTLRKSLRALARAFHKEVLPVMTILTEHSKRDAGNIGNWEI